MSTPSLHPAAEEHMMPEIEGKYEEQLIDELPEHEDDSIPHDAAPLTSTDVKADPILSALAKQQSVTSPKVAFKARPAPVTTRAEGLGPKMTKSAALRQGLDWEAMKPTRSESTRTVGFESTPGHKRTMSHNIASLAAPKTAPRQNRSSQLRSGGGEVEVVKKDMEAAAAENKAREKAERDARRKSVALPSSLSTPSIAPRMNRSSLLRAGSMKAPGSGHMSAPPVSWKPKAALVPTSAANVTPQGSGTEAKKTEEKSARRASMIGSLKSLATPSIAPRMNKAALLRAPGSSSGSIAPSPSMPTLKPAPRQSLAPPITTKSTVSTTTSSSTLPPSQPRASLAPHPGPKPTKASLLRAGLGAKIMASKA